MIDLTFITGKISYDELSSLKSTDLSDQVDALKEDMLQVEYSASLILDVGWYPSFSKDGCFQIRAIKDYEWSAPLFFSQASTIEMLIIEMTATQKEISKASLML